MGFCRRCGDIVPSQTARCKCGGTPVAPANLWNKFSRNEQTDDKWTKTYTTPPRSRANSASATPTKSPLTKSPFMLSGSSPSPNRTSKISTSPLRDAEKRQDLPDELPDDVIASLEDATLAKVYGSILQPTSDLPIHTCAFCNTIFAPDATIYPDLSVNSQCNSQFLCRSCFVIRGGSKGKCKACGRDVLVATNEGEFVEFSGKFWHKRCFHCENCNVDISHSPMVDIFGKPSCQGCFDNCTVRAWSPNKTPTKKLVEVTNNPQGTNREGRDNRPVLRELSGRLGVPMRTLPEDTHEPFLAKSTPSESKSDIQASHQHIDSPTKPRFKFPENFSENAINKTRFNVDTSCRQCLKPLLTRFGDGKFITAPDESGEQSSYHVQCFRCNICRKPLEGTESTPFVRNAKGICHPECADNERGRSRIVLSPLRITADSRPAQGVAKELQTAPPTTRIFPRFGDSETCPGCQIGVSVMEFGVVLGPHGKRWHKACLVCGGKGAKPPRPGCGKVLDSSAKLDVDGAVWCRECMLILPMGKRSSPQNSPTRNKLAPMHTGQVVSHLTGGSTTIARQFTGNAVGLLRNGSISPTRQLRSVSPTKGLRPISKYSRPIGARNKSVDEGRGMFLVRQMTGNGQHCEL